MKKVKIRTELLKQLAENNSFSEKLIKKEFPKLFENKLEIGKWYKVKRNFINDKESIVYFQGIGKKTYGFGHNENWTDVYGDVDTFCNPKYTYTLATPQEVETAFKYLMIKKGFTNGKKVKSLWKDNIGTLDFGFKTEFKLDENEFWMGGYCLFKNGKWAEIIETPNDITTIVEKYGKDKVISLIEKM